MSLHLAPETLPKVHQWIVDTTIEHDHEVFSEALKVSLQEVMIALKDEAQLLVGSSVPGYEGPKVPSTLYPKGFNAGAFIRLIQNDFIWKQTREAQKQPNGRLFNLNPF